MKNETVRLPAVGPEPDLVHRPAWLYSLLPQGDLFSTLKAEVVDYFCVGTVVDVDHLDVDIDSYVHADDDKVVDDEDYVDNEIAFYAQTNDDSDAEESTRKVFLRPLMTSR